MITPDELGDVGGAATTSLDGCESNRRMFVQADCGKKRRAC